MGGLRKDFVVIDAEHALGWRGRDSADGRREEARGDVGQHDKRAQAVVVGKASTNGEAGDLGITPFDGEVDGAGAEYVEVVGVVRVLPEILAAQDEVLAEGLLQAGVELIAEAGR